MRDKFLLKAKVLLASMLLLFAFACCSSYTPTGNKVLDAQAVNKDVGAYLYIPDTTVDEPVLSAVNYEDSTKFYEKYDTPLKRRDWKGKVVDSGVPGSLYLSTAIRENMVDREDLPNNLVIFGHNVGREDPNVPLAEVTLADCPDGPKFAQLFKFLDEDFAESHPYVYVSLAEEELVYEIFAVYYTETETKPKYYSVLLNDDDAMAVAESAMERSQWIYEDVTPEYGDSFLTLSTCSYAFTSDLHEAEAYRYVVMARLLPEDAAQEETTSVTANPSPKAPQV